MRVGVVFPQTEIGDDPAVIRDFAQAVEGLGFDHLLAYDHVLGADPDRPGGWERPYDKDSNFHEPMVLMGYLAGVTTTLELATGVLILPQRQTALVAKQAAEVAVLSGGRLRLGVGTGWNFVEYEALGVPFEGRGKRQAEQVALMRRLWKEDSIDFTGDFHRIDKASIKPRPASQIPVWFGGANEAVLKRAGRLGDGWMPNGRPDEAMAEAIARVRGYVRDAGRDADAFGIEGFVGIEGGPERWADHAGRWGDLGVSHLSLRVTDAGLANTADLIGVLEEYRDTVWPVLGK